VGDVTFAVSAEQFVCMVGPSGAGKTTLLKCIAGLLLPTAGRISLAGRPVDGPPPGMAVVFQEYGRSLFPWLTAEQNVDLPLRHKRLTRSRRRQLVADALDAVSLSDAHRAYPWQLSGGMQQRVAIARAIAYEPRILLMDEPFAAVDAQTRAELEDLVLDVVRRFRMTVLFITHDIDEAVYLSDRVLVLSASPTVVQDDVVVDLPRDRDQIATRSLTRFTELRSRIWAEVRAARGPAGSSSTRRVPAP
jgi:NitT/TauT family transport system ATP-binding protein